MPYPMGNIHPRFWSWYMGSSNFTGALADFLAAVQGSNLGGGNHAAALMDNQVVNWCKEMMGFPVSASGTLVSGGSMANLIALIVARNVKAGVNIREEGVGAIERPLRFYASDQVHSATARRWRRSGWATRRCVAFPTDPELRIDVAALRAAIAEDRAAGFQPACLIATAGTVNTGAIDDLEALANLAAEESSLAPRRRLHRRVAGDRACECLSRLRHRARRFRGARPSQMAARPFRSRLRPDPRRLRASRHLRRHAGVSGIDAARPRIGRVVV
jgi:glutamate/tyrosine decarboxylase-like PLP-dependent enzyme